MCKDLAAHKSKEYLGISKEFHVARGGCLGRSPEGWEETGQSVKEYKTLFIKIRSQSSPEGQGAEYGSVLSPQHNQMGAFRKITPTTAWKMSWRRKA